MPAIPQSEVLAKFFEEIGEKGGEILAKFFADFRPSPDPPILAFFDFLAFFVFRFSLLSLAVFLPFPRISGVPRREKPLLFWGKALAFSKKARVGGSGSISRENGRKKFHEKSSTFSTVHQIKFFHCCNSGGLGAQGLSKNLVQKSLR